MKSLAVPPRPEHDLLGDRDVPGDAYYGIQTLRAVENFPISGIRLMQYPEFVKALAFVKKACAITNQELGVLDALKTKAICDACDEIIEGKYLSQFVVDMVQGGAGTSTNMNANEVIANRALEHLGREKGEYQYLHPNDHVNLSQSTNDSYPTALKIAVAMVGRKTLVAMSELQDALAAKAKEFADVIKMGRTEEQDAVPMTLGQEFGAYACMIGDARQRLLEAGLLLLRINQGATAIGTGINSPPGFAARVAVVLKEISGVPVEPAENLIEATQDGGDYVQVSAVLKRVAVQLSKICRDLRLLSSGPRCGLNEINLPAMQPGSSIMPGKVNPVIPEVVNQVCYFIIGNDITVTMAAEAGVFELNAMEPIIALCLLQSAIYLRNACKVLSEKCVKGITANRDVCRRYVENSIGIVTALNPVIGYEKSVTIAKEALETGRSVYELVLEKGWLTKAVLEDILRPENMTHPRALPHTGS